MSEYTDSLGRAWRIRLTVATVERIRDETGIDLLAVVTGSLSAALQRDLVATANALFLASEPVDATEVIRRKIALGLSAVLPGRLSRWASRYAGRSFKRGFDGESLDRAGVALIEGVIDFFQPARREVLRAMWQKTRSDEGSASSMLVSAILSPKTTAAA